MKENRFYIASNLARWATILYDSKEDYPASLHAKAFECADQMQLMARALADTRANDIYGDTKEF